MTREELISIVKSNTDELYGIDNIDELTIEVDEKNTEDAILREVCRNNVVKIEPCQLSQMGKKLSEEHRKKISNSLVGRPISEETKMRMRQNNSRRVNVYQYSMSGDLVYVWSSTRQVERETGFNSSLISKVCRRKKQTAYGYKWRYKPLDKDTQTNFHIHIKKTYTH